MKTAFDKLLLMNEWFKDADSTDCIRIPRAAAEMIRSCAAASTSQERAEWVNGTFYAYLDILLNTQPPKVTPEPVTESNFAQRVYRYDSMRSSLREIMDSMAQEACLLERYLNHARNYAEYFHDALNEGEAK